MARKPADKLTKEGKRIFTELAKLSSLQVKAGFTADGGGHGVGGETVSADDYDNGVTVAHVAAWNEFGTKHIPPRPFMQQSVENNSSTIGKICEEMLKQVAAGKMDSDEALRTIGVMQVGLIQHEIREGGFVENAPSTKKQKGGSVSAQTTPLIDSGHMRQSVHYVVKDKDE